MQDHNKEQSDYRGTATYSPEDNKLRFYPFARLSKEDYTAIKAQGFSWAPKQELFVTSMWTPDREDFLINWCGEIGDEDKGLVDRAEERAERFEDYRDKRGSDAETAHRAVSAIADNIPLGQPILIGHHSERHARKDAERIENGMRKAVKMWETSKYWQDRAASAIRNAKYKERPDVRARRIKGIVANKCKQEREKAKAEKWLAAWSREELTLEQARHLANYCWLNVYQNPETGNHYSAYDVLQDDATRYKACPAMTVAGVQAIAREVYPRSIARYNRWISHYENRLVYERAMLSAAGGTVADKKAPEKGGACRCWASPTGGWSLIQKVNKVSVTLLDNWGNGGRDFTRTIPFDKLHSIMSKAEVDEARVSGRMAGETKLGFILLTPNRPPEPSPQEQANEKENAAQFEALKARLREGVQVVATHQLFPTPPEIAKRVIELADIRPGHFVLEPSAGTGALLRAMPTVRPNGRVVAVEINSTLAKMLESWADEIRTVDFLSLDKSLGMFDRVIMNPPFADGSDIKHILHARGFLKTGGRLVSICANGPRQREKLQPMAADWIDLEEGSFKESGTMVNAAIVVFEK
jgi:hypothetical protein